MPGLLTAIILRDIQRGRQADLLVEQTSAFNTALGSFTQVGADQQGPPLPGSESGMLLSNAQAEGLQNLFQASPQLGATMFSQLLNANQRAHQQQLTRDLSWDSADRAREVHDLNERKFDQALTAYEDSINPILQRQLKQAGETGALYVQDPLAGNALVRTAAPGTQEWNEITNNATLSRQVAQTYNAYAQSVAKFGVIEDPSEAGYGEQDALRTLLTFGIKEATKAGALDEGLILQTERLTGSAYDNRSYWLGNDAESLGRIQATGQLFQDSLEQSAEATRLISAWNPEQRNLFDQTRQQTTQLRDTLIPQRIANIRAAGGQVEDLLGAGSGNPRIDASLDRTGVELQRSGRGGPGAGGGRSREVASQLGAQFDQLISSLLGFAAGRLGR